MTLCIHGMTFCQLCNGPIGKGLIGPMPATLMPPPALPPCEHCWCEHVPCGGSYSRRGKGARPHEQCCQCGHLRLAAEPAVSAEEAVP